MSTINQPLQNTASSYVRKMLQNKVSNATNVCIKKQKKKLSCHKMPLQLSNSTESNIYMMEGGDHTIKVPLAAYKNNRKKQLFAYILVEN